MMEREVENEIVNFCGDVSVPDERKKKNMHKPANTNTLFFFIEEPPWSCRVSARGKSRG